MRNDKMCDIFETAGSKIWAPGVSILYIQDTFDCQVFKFSLGSFGAFSAFSRPCISETANRRAKQTNIWASGVSSQCI